VVPDFAPAWAAAYAKAKSMVGFFPSRSGPIPCRLLHSLPIYSRSMANFEPYSGPSFETRLVRVLVGIARRSPFLFYLHVLI
jgi:hypothetical protein